MLEPDANVAAEVMCIPKERQGPGHTEIKVEAKSKQINNEQTVKKKSLKDRISQNKTITRHLQGFSDAR